MNDGPGECPLIIYEHTETATRLRRLIRAPPPSVGSCLRVSKIRRSASFTDSCPLDEKTLESNKSLTGSDKSIELTYDDDLLLHTAYEQYLHKNTQQ